MSEMRGRSLEIYFVNGKPDGMLTAKVFNWTGHILMAPRIQIADALKRKESSFTGVYLLIGEQNNGQLLYIGEGEDIAYRIRQHDSKKDWWNTVILITSSANNLNKAHVKYLESRLVEIARALGKVALENNTSPTRPSLSEAAQANMEIFLDNLLMVLPALQIDAFLRNIRPSDNARIHSTTLSETPVFELRTPKYGIYALAKLEDGEFIVQEGSHARNRWVGAYHSYSQLHAELIHTGVLEYQPTTELCIFTANYAFKSPSAAAAVINGRSSNGTIEWKVKGQSVTYKEWEGEQLSADVNNGNE